MYVSDYNNKKRYKNSWTLRRMKYIIWIKIQKHEYRQLRSTSNRSSLVLLYLGCSFMVLWIWMQHAECMRAEYVSCIVRVRTAITKACMKTEGTRRSSTTKSWPLSLVGKPSVISYQFLTHSFADLCHLAECIWDFSFKFIYFTYVFLIRKFILFPDVSSFPVLVCCALGLVFNSFYSAVVIVVISCTLSSYVPPGIILWHFILLLILKHWIMCWLQLLQCDFSSRAAYFISEWRDSLGLIYLSHAVRFFFFFFLQSFL